MRLTAAFAAAMLLMLTAAALFVGLRLRDDLDDRIEASLVARCQAALRAYEHDINLSNTPLEDREEGFVQVLDETGSVVQESGTIDQPAITPQEVRAASGGTRWWLERNLSGIDGRARLLVQHLEVGGAPGAVVAGQSLVDRQDALSSVVTSFALGGLASVFLASAVGYGLARGGLAPVERMRRKAQRVSMSGSPATLPLPVARDEIRRLGETLNDMLGRLREAFDRERRFVADASHEIRTPLATIQLELEGVLRSGALRPDAREGIVAAHAECLRLARLADDLLVLARLDDGRLPLRVGDVDVRDTVTAVARQHAGAAAAAGRSVDLRLPDRLVIDADPDRFRQVVTNLVDNAVRHGAGTVTICAVQRDAIVELSVTDEGTGFPAQFAERAFDRFSRAESARSGDGAGLGLSLVATIAASHGGGAHIEPRTSTVRAWFPARPREGDRR